MVENIYSSQAHGSTSSVLVKVPKNVRQVGQVSDKKKIYVEDYVMSFIKKLGMKKDSDSELVVLLGQFVQINNCQCTFISGAIEIKGVIYEDNLVFSNEVWTSIYESIKKYFTNVEIVGWSMIRAGLPLNVDDRIRKVHVDNFAGQDKTLLLYDSLEREEAFYVFQENKLVRQDGYYIFYDKNAEMQNYIISLGEQQARERTYSTPKYTEPAKPASPKKQFSVPKRKNAWVYGAGAAAAVIVLVFSASMLNSYDARIQQKGQTTDVLSENVKQNAGKEKQAAQVTQEASLPVETAQGKLATINNDEEVEKPTSNQSSEKKKEESASKAEKKDKEESAKKKSKSEAGSSNETKKKTESTQASTSKNYYIVKKGDSLSSIAMKLYNSKSYVKKLRELNNIEDSDKIIIGQKILLP